MKKNSRWGRSGMALFVVFALSTTSCLQFKTQTEIKLESYKDTATIYKKNVDAPDGYSAEQIELTRYKLAKAQAKILDVGRTILSTLEIIGSIAFSAAMYMMLTTAKSLGRTY